MSESNPETRQYQKDLDASLSFKGSLEGDQLRWSWGHSWPWLVGAVLLVVGGPALASWLGVLFPGWLGLLASYVLAVALGAVAFIAGIRGLWEKEIHRLFRA